MLYAIWVDKAKDWVEQNRLPCLYTSKAAATRDLKDFAVDLKGYTVKVYRRVS
jgi:hypothetical protein